MAKQNVSIKYDIDEIFACREENFVMPRELEQYCNHINKMHKSALKELSKPMNDITKSHSYGINPDDVTLKSSIRENLNKINNSNYSTILMELEKLVYTSENHFVLLADELIVKCMNDVMAHKGVEASKPGHLTPSELYVNVMQRFSSLFIQDGSSQIKFKIILTKECHKFFNEMTDKKEKMDQHNPGKVKNYKGFMNMIGLLYTNGVFPGEIIRVCLDNVIKLILESKLSQDECDNYYSGCERLISRIIAHFEKNIFNVPPKEFNNIKTIIDDFNSRISKECPNDEKKAPNESGSSTNHPSHPSRPLRIFSIMTHYANVARFNKLCNSFKDKEKS